MEIENTLKQLGLSDKEIAIYLTLLPIGSTPASILGSRTGITRSTAQYTCQQLQKKGLIRSIQKGNTLIYSPEPPEKLLYLLEEQKRKIDQKEAQVERILGDLKGMINPQALLPKVKFFEGVSGIKEMVEDMFKEKNVIYGMLRVDDNIHPEILTFMNEEYYPRRAAFDTNSYVLFNDNDITKHYLKKDEEINRTSLLLPVDDFPLDVCCHIYGNTLAFYSWEKSDLTGVLINNKNIQNTVFSLFKLAWKYARTLKINTKYKDVDLT